MDIQNSAGESFDENLKTWQDKTAGIRKPA